MLFRLIYYLLIGYLFYRAILFIGRLLMSVTKKPGINNPAQSPKSRFKDIEEANYTEIKEDKDNKDKDSN